MYGFGRLYNLGLEYAELEYFDREYEDLERGELYDLVLDLIWGAEDLSPLPEDLPRPPPPPPPRLDTTALMQTRNKRSDRSTETYRKRDNLITYLL